MGGTPPPPSAKIKHSEKSLRGFWLMGGGVRQICYTLEYLLDATTECDSEAGKGFGRFSDKSVIKTSRLGRWTLNPSISASIRSYVSIFHTNSWQTESCRFSRSFHEKWRLYRPLYASKKGRGAESETIGFPENGYSLRCRDVPECQITNYNLMFCFFLNLFHKIYKYLVWDVERDGAGRSSKSILYYASKKV